MKIVFVLFFAFVATGLIFSASMKKNIQTLNIVNFRFIQLREYGVNDSLRAPIPIISYPPCLLLNKEYEVHTDENGFITTKRNHSDPQIKFVFMGGSTTECLYVNEFNRYPENVARLVEKESGRKINSYNCGVGGNNSLNSIDILINKVLPLKPDLVFFNHNINDLITLCYLHTYWSKGYERSPIMDINYVKGKYNSNQGLEKRDEFQNIGDYIPLNDSLLGIYGQAFRNNVRTFIGICRANNIEPVLLSQPNNFSRLDLAWFITNRKAQMARFKNSEEILHFIIKGTARFNEILREESNVQHCLFIDLSKGINNVSDFYDEVHLNDSGSIHVSNIIAQKLRNNSILHLPAQINISKKANQIVG